MRYQLLGRTGLRVSELCLGTMAFGEDWGWGASKDECARIVDAFAEAGGNFIDTADKYTNGSSERYLGELIASRRDRWVLATKYSLSRDESDPNGAGNHRKSLVHALDASLRRLRTDYVDLLWLHIWDFVTPIEEVMRALDDQVRAGKVLYVGISDTPAWIVSRANTLAELRGWTPFSALQAEYSLIERTAERELVPMAEALDLALTPWSPLGQGVLTGKYSDGAAPATDDRVSQLDPQTGRRLLTPRNLEISRVLGELASQLGASSAQVALAWLLTRPGTVIPIVGARRESQIRDNLGAVEIELSPEQLERLDAASAIERGFPHDFYDSLAGDSFVFGDAYSRLDRDRPPARAAASPVAARDGQTQ